MPVFTGKVLLIQHDYHQGENTLKTGTLTRVFSFKLH